MALCIPSHLRQRTSRVYQDHPHFCRVLTSFVPPVHNQGVSLAPLQGHALWWLFLPTTGSFFFVLSLTDLFKYQYLTAPYGGRFPDSVFILLSLPVTAEFNSPQLFLKVQFNCDRTLPVCLCLLRCLQLWPSDITHQFHWVIIHTLCQDCVEYLIILHATATTDCIFFNGFSLRVR